MITRSSVRPHVCLRCQRKSTKRLVPSKFSLGSFHSASNSHTTEYPSQSSGTPQLRIHRVAANEGRRSTVYARKGTDQDGIQHTELGYEPGNDVSRLHGHRGRKLQEKVEDLNTNSLGDAAKVIVLQDSKYNFYSHLNRMEDEVVKHVDIESVLEKEKGAVGVHEVNKSIDGLRKVSPPQTWEELNEFVRMLSDGFTHSQLLRYVDFSVSRIAEAEVVQELPDAILQPTYPSPHILNVTSWMPAISEVSDYFDEDPLRGYYMPSHTSKQKLALKLVRECWNWDVPEISEGLGQFEVQISRSDLDLLSKGSDSPLALLHEEYLAHEDEAMEVFPSRGVIRVTTMRHKMDIVVDILARDLDSIQREPIYLGALFPKMAKGRDFMSWQDQTFNDGVLQELGQITDTEISRISKNTLLVSCFVDSEKSGLASRIDTVKRLLTTASDVADKSKYTLESDSLTDGMFIRYPRTEGLGWREKMRDWVRWTGPISKSRTNPAVGEPIRQEEATEDANDNVEQPQQPNEPPTSSRTTSWWNVFNDTSALFGSILHTSLIPGRNLTDPFDPSIKVRRGFSPLVPNISRSIQRTTLSTATRNKLPTNTPLKYITLRFLPDPFQPHWNGNNSQRTIDGHTFNSTMGSEVIKHLPQVEMRFSVAEDNSTKLKDVLAIFSETKSDVMLPLNGVDIRFQDRTTRRLKLGKNMDRIQEFVTASILDLRKGRMLTPPTLKLPIDPEMLSSSDRRILSLGKEPQEVQYMFAGLDVRSTLVFDWKNWRVDYTSIEAGQAGGRRGELKLRPIIHHGVTSRQAFVNAANELAHELGDSTPGAGPALSSPHKEERSSTRRVVNKKDVPRWKVGGSKEPSIRLWGLPRAEKRYPADWQSIPAVFGGKNPTPWFENQDVSWDLDDGEEYQTSVDEPKEPGGLKDDESWDMDEEVSGPIRLNELEELGGSTNDNGERGQSYT